MTDDLARQAAAIGALAEPVRRALYRYVVAQPDAVGREQAATAVDVPVHTAKFHLDKLVEEGLLEVEFRRLGGRSGPGAGRPAKLYHRSPRDFGVSLPARRYDLVGHILASAVRRAAQGVELDRALRDCATGEGRAVAAAADPPPGFELDRLAAVLADHGYEPRAERDALLLTNCPFDSLAQQHTEVVCGLNQAFVQGVADGLGCSGVEACLEPDPARCCVTVRATPGSS